MERRRDPEAPRRRPADAEYREGAPKRPRRPAADTEGRTRRQGEFGDRPVRGGQEGPRRRPMQDGSERPIRRSPQDGPRDRGEVRQRRRPPEGYREDPSYGGAPRRRSVPEMGSDEDIDRMIQEKYREIEYLESQSRREGTERGISGPRTQPGRLFSWAQPGGEAVFFRACY